MDHVVRLETSIRETIMQKHLVTIFFDQEKATWRYGIMNEAYELPLKLRFTKSALQHNSKLKSLLSNPAMTALSIPNNKTYLSRETRP